MNKSSRAHCQSEACPPLNQLSGLLIPLRSPSLLSRVMKRTQRWRDVLQQRIARPHKYSLVSGFGQAERKNFNKFVVLQVVWLADVLLSLHFLWIITVYLTSLVSLKLFQTNLFGPCRRRHQRLKRLLFSFVVNNIALINCAVSSQLEKCQNRFGNHFQQLKIS